MLGCSKQTILSNSSLANLVSFPSSNLPLNQMAGSWVSRFVAEAAPPQFVCVMRRRVSKILDTIIEEEREYASETNHSSSKMSMDISSSAAAASPATSPSCVLREVKKTLYRDQRWNSAQ
ncbi:hypothetical protein ACLOJK_021776 [Asimina triloba]